MALAAWRASQWIGSQVNHGRVWDSRGFQKVGSEEKGQAGTDAGTVRGIWELGED